MANKIGTDANTSQAAPPCGVPDPSDAKIKTMIAFRPTPTGTDQSINFFPLFIICPVVKLFLSYTASSGKKRTSIDGMIRTH
jgi:hypothetical protein